MKKLKAHKGTTSTRLFVKHLMFRNFFFTHTIDQRPKLLTHAYGIDDTIELHMT